MQRVRVRVRSKRKRRRRRRRWWRLHPVRAALLGVAALAALLALDGAWAASTVAHGLPVFRDYLQAGVSALEAGHTAEAEADLALARSSAASVSAALRQPAAEIAGWLPILGPNVDAIREMASASDSAAAAAESLTGALRATGWDGQSIPGWKPGGGVDLAVVERVQPFVNSFSSYMSKAAAAMGSVSTSGLFGTVRRAVTTVRTNLDAKAHEARSLATLTGLLPKLLGGQGTRRYLLLVQNLSDPRGSGGFPGEFGVLTAANGRLSLGPLLGGQTLQRKVPPVSAPKEVRVRYGRFGGLTRLIASTYSPDFPTTARIILEMWKALGHPPPDGVIAVDSVWMSYVLRAIGPVKVPGLATPISADNADAMIGKQPFLLPSAQADALETLIGETLFHAVLSRSPSIGTLASGMAEAASQRHLQMYATDPSVQTVLSRLGVSGAVTLAPNPLMVAWDGATANRAGYFAQKQVTYRATLAADGSAEVAQTIVLHNGAPKGPPSVLLGRGGGTYPVGYYGAYVNAYMAAGATAIRQTLSNSPGFQLVGNEFDHPVALQFLGTPSGTSVTWQLGYRLASATTTSGGMHRFELQILPQPALNPDAVSVSVTLPAGAHPLATSPGLKVAGQTLTYQGSPVAPTTVWVEYR